MNVVTIWVLSVFWIGYGILGILGIQNIPEKYKYKSWTPDYIRMNGIGMVIFGASWFILGFVLKAFPLPPLQGFGLTVLFTLPALGDAIYVARKSKAWRRQADEEWRQEKQNR